MTQVEKLHNAGILKDPDDIPQPEKDVINKLEDPEVDGLISAAKSLGLKGTLHDWAKGGAKGGDSDLF